MSPIYIAKGLTREELEIIERSDKAFAEKQQGEPSATLAAKMQSQQTVIDATFERQQAKAKMIKQANKD